MPTQYKMKEITKNTGISKSTVLYYISLGLLPEPTKTFKNMAYYPASYLDILPVIRYLQENMRLPLGVIKQLIDHIGFEKISLENALHYYETFLTPFRYSKDATVYGSEEFTASTNLDSTEIQILENMGLLFPLGNGLYSNDDLLVANAYKNLAMLGFTVSDLKELANTIKKLTRETHELYHKRGKGLSPEKEQALTQTMRKELETIFAYLMGKYMLLIYREEGGING